MHRISLVVLLALTVLPLLHAQGVPPSLASGTANPAAAFVSPGAADHLVVEIRFVSSTTTTQMPTLTELRVNNLSSSAIAHIDQAKLWRNDLGTLTLVDDVTLTGFSGGNPITFTGLNEQITGGEAYRVTLSISATAPTGMLYQMSIGPSEVSWTAASVPGTTVTGGLQTVLAATPLAISTAATLPDGTASMAYTHQFAALGGTGPYAWGATSLPSNWTMSSGGLLHAAAGDVVQGTHTLDVQVADSAGGTASGTFSVTVIQGGSPLSITFSSLGNLNLGVDLQTNLTAAGGNPPYTWSSTNLPSTFTLQPNGSFSTGYFNLGAGPGSFDVTVTDSISGTATASISYNVVVPPPLVISTTTLPAATVGQPYNQVISASGGTGAPYLWSLVDTLPPGLNATFSTTGEYMMIAGTPTAAGAYTFSVTVVDTPLAYETVTYTLSVAAAPASPGSPASGSNGSGGGGGCVAGSATAPWLLAALLLIRRRRKQ
jgi:hypothetical protein